MSFKLWISAFRAILIAFISSTTLQAQNCILTTPYTETFSGTGGGWIAPTSFFNQGSLNSCWERDSGYTWIKAPTVTGGSNNLTGPSGDYTNGGNGYLSADNSIFTFNDFEAKLISPFISLANDTAPQLSFWYHLYGSEIEELLLDIRKSGTTNWVPLDTIKANSGAFVAKSSPWHLWIAPLDSFVNDTVQFRFIAKRQISVQYNGANCRAALDDLSVTEWDGSCRVPLNLKIASKGISNAVVEWQSINGQASYEVQYAQGNGIPSSGTSTFTTTNTFNYTGLAPNSTYTLRVRSICAPGDTSDWSSYITIQTDCGLFNAPWTEDFEGSSWVTSNDWSVQGSLDPCFADSASLLHFWKVCSGPLNGNSGPNADHSPTGPGKYLSINHRSTISVDPFKPALITPWISLDSLTSPELTFWLHAYSKQFNIGDLSVLIESLDGNITSILDTTGNLQGTQSSPWKEIILDLNAFKADTIRVRFKYTANQASQEQQLAIDDISIDEEPSCPRPKFTKVISTNTTTADLKWSSGGSSHHQVRYKQANASVWTNVSTNSSNITLTGLQPNTSYRWEVRDSCGANDLSDWVQGPSFFTNCTLFTAPYTNTFSSNSWQGPTPFSPKGSIGNCFTRLETSGYFWTGARSGFDHVAFTGPNSDHTGGSSGYMFARAETSAFDTANIELPMIDLDTLKGPEFSFWWHMYGQAIDRLNVYVRSPGGPETLLGSIVGSQTASANGNWTKETYSLYSFTGDTVIIRMEALKNTGNIFTSLSAVIAIDDIKIDESPNCPPVTASGTVILNGSMVTGVSTGNPVDSVLWNWGDGNFVVADSASYNYPAPGIYQVQQVAYNYCGNSDTITTNLTVCGQVQANISSQSAGTSLAFSATNSVGAGLTYLWYFGDGTTASSTTPNHTYSTPGTYAVSLVVVDVCGTSDSTAQSITVCPNVNLAFNYTNSNTTFSFTASPSNLTNYTWDFGDGNTGTGLSTSHTYANGGNYTVTLTGVDSCGGIWTDSMIISSCPPLAGDFTFNIISSGANGMLVQFLANVSGASGLIWNWGDGTQSSTTATNISHSYPTANLGYIIQLTIINECGDTLEIVRSLNEVSLSELSSEQTTLYPNPARGSIITLEFAHSVNGSYDILDISGTVFHTAPIPSLQSINIPIDGLKSGYYIIRLKDQGSSFQKSFIKID